MMANRKFPLLLVAMLVFPGMLLGQLKQDTQVNVGRALKRQNSIDNIVGLLGLSLEKFSMSHSYSLAFATSGGRTFNQGLYLNSMKYRLFDPLALHLQIGVHHQPFGNQVGAASSGPDIFVSGAGMEYTPSDNFKLQLEFSQQPSSYYYLNSPFLDPISRNSAWFNRQDEKQTQVKDQSLNRD